MRTAIWLRCASHDAFSGFTRFEIAPNNRQLKEKILITTTTFPRWQGDTEPRFVLDLARQLAEEFDPTVLAPIYPGAKIEETHGPVHIKRYRYAPMRQMEVLTNPGSITGRIRENPLLTLMVPFLLWGLTRAVTRELASSNYACVHAHWLLPQGTAQTRLRRKGLSPPFLITSHGGDLGLLPNRLLEHSYRKVLDTASAVTAAAPWIAHKLMEIDPSLEAGEIPVIPMGTDLETFSPARRENDWKHRYNLKGLVVLFVGRLTEKKGVVHLIDAMESAELRDIEATLAIVGEGPLMRELKERVDRLGLQERIRFLGAMGHDTLPEALASSDIFCVPSVVARNGDLDGTPTVMFEAGASGLPIIGSDLAGIPTMVVHERTGLLTLPGDASSLAVAIRRLLLDEKLRARLGAAAQEHARNFSWVRIAERFVPIINGVISGTTKFG